MLNSHSTLLNKAPWIGDLALTIRLHWMFLCSCCPGTMKMIIMVLAKVIKIENALWSVETTFLLRQLHCSRWPQHFLYNKRG